MLPRYLSRLDYGNGDNVQYTYDDKGRVTRQTYEDGAYVSYTYDNSGILTKQYDSATGRTTVYTYDTTGRLMKYTETGTNYSHSVVYDYDPSNNLSGLEEKTTGVRISASYAYDNNNRITSISAGGFAKDYTYDDLGRVSQQQTENGNTTILTETFSYIAGTSQVSSITTSSAGYTKTESYTYDDNGNILTVSDGTNTTSYVYDSANQLIRENNQAGGFTYTWTYDNAGNILSRTEYAYTTGALGTPTDTDSYTYGDSNWGDLLTAYDGTAITYDGVGNPLSDGTRTYEWKHGRQLASMTDGATTWTYSYDANGMRTGRTDGTTSYTYVYNGGQLTKMTSGAGNMVFFYDTEGRPVSLLYKLNLYYYVVNSQGDVIGILDGSGNPVVSYTYNAYGGLQTMTGSKASTVGQINPLRYRGYFFDSETGLYYVGSRYYNPEMGRFINADSQLNPQDGLLGFNMCAYCNNNPITYSDPTGHSIILACIVIGAAIGAVAGGCAGAYISKKQTGKVNGWAIAAGAIGGGIVGGLVGWGVGSAIVAAGAATTSAVSGTIAQVGHEIYQNWQSAEQGLRETIGSVVDYGSRVLSTPAGERVVDAYNTTTKVIAEAKYGYQALTSFIQTEVARDAWLLQSGAVSEVQWHFYFSQVSETIGGSYPLIRALLESGIQVFYH